MMYTKEGFLKEAKEVFNECFNILTKKNSDYGADADPFKNFRRSTDHKVDPDRGILVRHSDKMSRIDNLLEKEPSVVEESIEDTCKDAINYMLIFLLYQREKRSQKKQPSYGLMAAPPLPLNRASQILAPESATVETAKRRLALTTVKTAELEELVERMNNWCRQNL